MKIEIRHFYEVSNNFIFHPGDRVEKNEWNNYIVEYYRVGSFNIYFMLMLKDYSIQY